MLQGPYLQRLWQYYPAAEDTVKCYLHVSVDSRYRWPAVSHIHFHTEPDKSTKQNLVKKYTRYM